MKKITLIFVLAAFLCASSAYSQQKPFVFGFKAGPTMGWMKPDAKGYDSDGIKPGFTWGFIADFFLMENYGIATGFDVVFLNGGIKMPHQVLDGTDTISGNLNRKYKLKYIQIPVTLKLRTKELGKFRIFGQIGLGTNFLIGAKADDEFTPDEGEPASEEVDIYDDITFMRESLILGAGVEFSLGGSTNLTAGFVFNNGFMNILKGENSVDPTINNKANANYLALEFGIVF
ncbi:MAG: PorT family protein [Bacteroidales bacterium]|nr:PorT family protein [Bacteroidales bacterium]